MPLTVGINTYVTPLQADLYFEDRLRVETWTAAEDEDKDKALLMARRLLDRQAFAGSLADDNQILAWPRSGLVDREGRAVDPSTVPADVRDAQCELALAFLREDLTADDGRSGVRREKIGEIEVEYDGRAPAKAPLPEIVAALLKPYLAATGSATSVRIIP